MTLVIDASVGIKWFLDDDGCDAARGLLADIFRSPGTCAVPELFYYEVHAVCVRRHPRPDEFAEAGVSLLMQVPLARFPLTPALAMAASPYVQLGLTGYDAAYAALAHRLRATWVTSDAKAARKVGRRLRMQVI